MTWRRSPDRRPSERTLNVGINATPSSTNRLVKAPAANRDGGHGLEAATLCVRGYPAVYERDRCDACACLPAAAAGQPPP